MRFPEEVVVDSFLPTFRFMLAKELESKGLREGKIADIMGLSQAAVSKYRLGKIKKVESFLNDQQTKKKVKELAKSLFEGSISSYQAMSEAIQLIRSHETRGLICRLHESEYPAIEGLGCNLCLVPQGGEVLEEENVLSNVRAGLRLLQSLKGFHNLIPNVGSNLAMAMKGAKDLAEVAAVPGRIYEMRGMVRIPASPELSASRHVAGVVLAVCHSDPEMRSAMNIKFSDDILSFCKSLDWKMLEINAEYEGREADLTQKLSKQKTLPKVIFHRGGFGIEPMIYIIGETAVKTVESVKELLEKIST